MNKLFYLSVLIIILISSLGVIDGTTNATCNGGINTDCYHLNLNNAIAGIIGAGDIEQYVTYPHEAAEADSVVHVGIGTFGPAITSVTITYTPTGFSGCTLGTAVTKSAATTQTFQGWVDYPITLRNTECSGYIEALLAGGVTPTTIMDTLIPVNILTKDSPQNVLTTLCDATSTTSKNYNTSTTTCENPQIDNHNTLCGASTSFGGTTCNLPQMDVHNTLCQASTSFGSTTCNTPQIDEHNTLCDATTLFGSNTCNRVQMAINICSSHLNQCNGLYINGTIQDVNSGSITQSGTIHNVIDSWPILQQKLISGNMTVCLVTSNAGCGSAVNLNEINSGAITVTNAGGQSITVTSWPTLITTLNQGTGQWCGATITCKSSMSVNSTTTIANANITFASKVENSLKLSPYLLVMIAVAFLVVVAEYKGDAWYWIFAFLASLYLLILRPATSSIPIPIFVGWLFVCLYQVLRIIAGNREIAMRASDN